jgi:spore maturation protein SpmA/spore maturation protein SpmB
MSPPFDNRVCAAQLLLSWYFIPMNSLMVGLILAASLAAAFAELNGHAGALVSLTEAMVKSAQDAVQLALTLAASMAVFMGVLRIAQSAGLMPILARPLLPLLRKLFPHQKDAWDAIALNVSANLLGMGNAATPFGLKAMTMLEQSNSQKGTASDAQIMFLALNTAGITLLPAKVIALRASLGSTDPAAIIGPTLAASLCAAVAGILTAWLFSDRSKASPPQTWLWTIPLAFVAGLAIIMVTLGTVIGPWLMPLMIVSILVIGRLRGILVYEEFVEGAKEGLLVTWRIAPYLIAILVTVGMARNSGALDMVLTPLGHILAPLGVPPQALLMALIRTMSGSGAFGLLASSLALPESGPDTPLGILLSTLYGSTETTFYVIAVYFGSVGTVYLRHAIIVGLVADGIGLLAATLICSSLYG